VKLCKIIIIIYITILFISAGNTVHINPLSKSERSASTEKINLAKIQQQNELDDYDVPLLHLVNPTMFAMPRLKQTPTTRR
jgi:hypothetical protein